MVIFQVDVVDFSFCSINAEGQTTVAGDREAPRSLAVARQRVYLPRRESTQFLRVFHVVEERQHLSQLVHRIRRNAFCGVLSVELLQALMNEVPYFHLANCSPLLNTCQEESASGGELEQLRIQVGGLALPVTIPAGQNASFTMTFSPQVSGAASATLSFTSNAPLHYSEKEQGQLSSM